MDSKKLSRITIALPKEQHRLLKAKAAMLGKSISEVIIEAIEAAEQCPYLSHEPNKTTRTSLKNIEKRRNLVAIESIDEIILSRTGSQSDLF